METGKMRKMVITLSVMTTAIFFTSTIAFAWGSATHAFIDNHLKKKAGPYNLDEIYGSMSPDLFNFMLQEPYVAYHQFLHDKVHLEFMSLHEQVKKGRQKALDYGFVSHNESWGADYTAHVGSLTMNPLEGYIITKAFILDSILLQYVPEYAALGLPQDVALEINHNIMESAGDIIIKRTAPDIGFLMVDSASRPYNVLQRLLVDAYAADLVTYSNDIIGLPLTYQQAAGVIMGVEAGFRARQIIYGTSLQKSEAEAMADIALDFNSLAESYLDFLGFELPGNVDLIPLIGLALQQAVYLCEGDYMDEIYATIDFVDLRMKENKISKKIR